MNQPIENMLKIATRLATLYKQRVTVAINLRTHQRLLDDRKLQIIPPEGWAGKNADERSVNERRTYASDKTIMETTASIDRYQIEVDKIDAEIAALEAERRAGEHIVYAMMADALGGIRNRSTAPAIGRAAVQDAGKYAVTQEIAKIEIDPELLGEIARQVNEGAGEQVTFQAGGYVPTEQTEEDDLPF